MLTEKVPQAGVGLARARLKEPLQLTPRPGRRTEGECCYYCKQQGHWPFSTVKHRSREARSKPFPLGSNTLGGSELSQAYCWHVKLVSLKKNGTSVGPGLTALMWVVPRTRCCPQTFRYYWYCWFRTTWSRQEAGLLTPTHTTSLDCHTV